MYTPLIYNNIIMERKELKEQVIQRLSNDPRIYKSRHIDNQNNSEVMKKANESYKEVIDFILVELEK